MFRRLIKRLRWWWIDKTGPDMSELDMIYAPPADGCHQPSEYCEYCDYSGCCGYLKVGGTE